MLQSLQARVVVILALIAIAGGYLFTQGIKLGLDLQGGIHLALEVDDPDNTMTAEARADAIDRAERIVRTRIDEFGVEEPLIQKVGADRLIVELAGQQLDQSRAKDIIQQSAYLEWKLVLPGTELENVLPRIDRQIVASIGEDELRAMGQTEIDNPASSIENLLFQGGDSASGDDSTAASADEAVADATDEQAEGAQPEPQVGQLRPLSSLLSRADPETFLIPIEDVETAQRFLDLPEVQRALPRDVTLHWGWEDVAQGTRVYRELYILQEDPFLTGDMLEGAVAQRDPQFGQSVVQFDLTRRGGRVFSRVTRDHIQERIAIVLDNEVVSAPVVQSRIGASGQIELGASPLEEARDLALVLRAGALPAPLRIEEERTVGPSLGADSIAQGQLAGIIGLILVVVVMIAYYRLAGVFAVGALAVYVILVLGGLSAIGATLTLPGIAGLILSVGMAVDANVLIFERIREELDMGRTPRTAIDEGFSHALSAIVDANITTLITALILFQFGTGPVQGFAVTLTIGIIASFFSALYVTRTFFLLYLSRRRNVEALSI